MEKSDTVPSIWRDSKHLPTSNIWVKTDDPSKATVDQRRMLSNNRIEIYGLMRSFPLLKERLLFFGGVGSQFAGSAISGLVLSAAMRKRFHLGYVWWQGMSSAYAAIAVSSFLVLVGNDHFVVQRLFYNQSDICINCLQIRQALINIGAAVIFPNFILIPEYCYYALKDPKYPGYVPRIGEFRKFGQFVLEKYTKGPLLRQLGWLALLNAATGFLGPYMEMKAAIRVTMAIEDDPSLLSDHIQRRQSGLFATLTAKIVKLLTKSEEKSAE